VTATGRVNAIIEHPPGVETQWDWLDLPDPPVDWGWGRHGAGRVAGPFGAVAGDPVAVDGPAAPDRRWTASPERSAP